MESSEYPEWVIQVALLAEGVDRNQLACRTSISTAVALLAEGVDRNKYTVFKIFKLKRRPPRGGRG